MSSTKPRAKGRRASAGTLSATPQAQLARFIAKFSPETAAIGKAAVNRMQKRFPNAVVLVYDNYNALAVGFAPSERASEAVFSIAFYSRRVNLCFLQAGRSNLKDPSKLLQGSGRLNRFIPLKSAETLDQPDVRDLMDQALVAAVKPFPSSSKGYVVIKGVSAKQRPRRPD